MKIIFIMLACCCSLDALAQVSALDIAGMHQLIDESKSDSGSEDNPNS